jgi:tRNA G46 methylase TrmB
MCMAGAIDSPRSKYADKLAGSADCVFTAELAAAQRGQWRDFFRQRIGPTFDGRIILEVGCWDAIFLSQIASRFPRSGFLGLDWKFKPLYDAGQRISGDGPGNVALIRGRGQDLGGWLGSGEADEVWVFHPDPCDRESELDNRLIRESFLLNIHPLLRPSGLICMKTDHPGYYQWILSLIGLPEPAWFAASRDPGTPRPVNARVRARDLVPPERLPPKSSATLERFTVTMNSPNFWHDPAALQYTFERYFSGEVTAFERRFVRKRFPIYYVELQKNDFVESEMEIPF